MFRSRQDNRSKRTIAVLTTAVSAALACHLLAPVSVQAKAKTPSAEDCDPIVIGEEGAKKPAAKPVRKVARKAPVSKPAAKDVGPKAQTASVKPKPKPKPKPKAPMTTLASAKPLVIPDACPGAGSNEHLPTSLKDIATQQSVEETLSTVFPDPAAGGMSPAGFPTMQRLTTLAPSNGQRSTGGATGPTVSLVPPGGGVGGVGGVGTPPGGGDPGGEDPGGEDPGGEDPGGEDPGGEDPGGEDPGREPNPNLPQPPTKVPEPGTFGVLLAGLGGLFALRRRNRR